MRGLNRVQLIGNVGHDPDVTYTDQGTARTTFNIAINRQWKDANGQVHQETEWVPVLTWGALAEIAGEHITRGKRLYVEGRLHTSTWTTDDTGEKRSRTEVIAQELILLSPRTEHSDNDPDTAEASGHHETSTSAQQRRYGAQTSSEPDWDAMGL